MLIGNYQAKLSTNGRTAIPKKFRDRLGRQVVITQGYEQCLVMVSQADWQQLVPADKPFILDVARETDRFLLGNAFELEPDSQGRIVIPGALQDYAGLKEDIFFVGVGNRVEVWSAQRWENYREYLTKNSSEIARKLVGSN